MALFMHSRYAVKESQALAKIPDTLVFAMEFLTLPMTAVSAAGVARTARGSARLRAKSRQRRGGAASWRRLCVCVCQRAGCLAHIRRLFRLSCLLRSYSSAAHARTLALPLTASPSPLQDQGPALAELRRTVLRVQPDLKDKPAFWKRHPAAVKVGGVCGFVRWSVGRNRLQAGVKGSEEGVG